MSIESPKNPDKERWERQWHEVYVRRKARKEDYLKQEGIHSESSAQILSYLNDAQLGQILAAFTKISNGLAEKYNIRGVTSPTTLRTERGLAERDMTNRVMGQLADEILSRHEISQSDLEAGNFPYFDLSPYAGGEYFPLNDDAKLIESQKNKKLDTNIWHEICQHPENWLKEWMPNILEIPESERADVLSVAMEKFVQENIDKEW